MYIKCSTQPNEFKKKIFDIKNSYSNLIINRLGIYAMQREFMDDTEWYILEFYLDDYSKNKSNDYIDKFEQDNSRLILDSGNRYCVSPRPPPLLDS